MAYGYREQCVIKQELIEKQQELETICLRGKRDGRWREGVNKEHTGLSACLSRSWWTSAADEECLDWMEREPVQSLG